MCCGLDHSHVKDPQINRDGKAFPAQAQGMVEPFSGSVTAVMKD